MTFMGQQTVSEQHNTKALLRAEEEAIQLISSSGENNMPCRA